MDTSSRVVSMSAVPSATLPTPPPLPTAMLPTLLDIPAALLWTPPAIPAASLPMPPGSVLATGPSQPAAFCKLHSMRAWPSRHVQHGLQGMFTVTA